MPDQAEPHAEIEPATRLPGAVEPSKVSADALRLSAAERALRESEKRFRTCFEYAHVGMAILGLDQKFVDANDALCKMLGYSRAEMLDLNSESVTYPEDIEINRKAWDRIIAGKLSSFHSEKRYVRKDGEIVWGSLNSTVVCDDHGKPHQIVAQIEDITERKRAERELEQAREDLEARVRDRTRELEFSQQRFRDFAESAADRLWETDAQHRYTYASRGIPGQMLPPPEVVLGKARWELDVVDLDPAVWQRHRSDLEAQRPFRDFRYSLRGIDGSVHRMKASGKPVYDAEGKFLGYRGVAVDETAAVTAREEIADIQAKYSTAMENISEGFAVWGPDDAFVYCNSYFRQFHAWAEHTLVPGASYQQFVAELAKGEWGSRAEIGAEDWAQNRLAIDGEFADLVDTLDGRWVQVRKETLQDGSTAILFSDITEQKRSEEALRESEERFRKSFENAAIGMAIVGVDGRFRLVNRALCEMVGYSAPELLATTVIDITHPDDREDTQNIRNGLLKGERSNRPQEKRYIHKDGRVIWASLSRAVIKNADGRSLYTIGQVQDITEHKQSEDRLRQALKMEAVGQLTGGVAHDFNNLLAAILGNLELIGNKVGADPDLQRRIDRAIRSAKAGGELTNRLLAFSRRQNLNPKMTNLGRLVSNMLDLLERSLSESISITTDFESELWPTLVDQNQLENVILNLAINARDVMPDGGTLKVQCANATMEDGYSRYFGQVAAGDYVCLSVSDTGTGMSSEVQDRLFEPFFTTKPTGEGSGLGLSMVFGFIKQTGGHIEIDSSLGDGTTISIYVPVADGDAMAAEIPDRPASIPKGNGEKILLIEDDEAVRASTAEMLEHLGYTVVDGGDGAGAMDILAVTPDVRLLLTDVVLTNGNSGPVIAAQTKKYRPDLQVLMMTGYAEKAKLFGEGDKRLFPLIRKPFQIGVLAIELDALLTEAAGG